jgi:hypothetical protein
MYRPQQFIGCRKTKHGIRRKLMFELDFSEVKEVSYEAIPNGKYIMSVDDVEFKTSSAGHEYLSLKFKINEGQYENRVVYSNYNINHPNEKVRNIAKGQLKAVLNCSLSDNLKFSSKEELKNSLFGIQGEATLGIRKDQNGNDQNVIKSIKKIDATKTAASAPF